MGDGEPPMEEEAIRVEAPDLGGHTAVQRRPPAVRARTAIHKIPPFGPQLVTERTLGGIPRTLSMGFLFLM